MKRFSALLLSMLILLASCSEAAPQETERADTPAAENQTAVPETAAPLTELEKRASVKDSLPEKDFGGTEFRISTKRGTLYEIAAEELTGDLLNDALYDRNLRIEDRFNARIVPVITEAGDGMTQVNNVRQSIIAADNTFDLAATYVYTTGSIITDGYYRNWLNMDWNDFSMPWWIHGINDNFRVGDAVYAVVGDMCLSTLKLTYGLFYNRTRGEDYGLNVSLYDTVLSGNWYLDDFLGAVSEVYEDTNGDTIRDSEDFYGFTGECATNLDIYSFAFDIPIMRRNEAGKPELVFNTEKAVSAAEKISRLYWEMNGSFIPENDSGLPVVMFKDGHALFTTTWLGNAFASYREMENDYSILPYPKWDENQEKYMTGAMDNYSVLGMPITVDDPEMVSILTESLNVESYRTLFPVYYEQALQNKYSRDPESIEMINMLMEGRNFDFSTLFAMQITGISTLFRTVINSKNADFASNYAKIAKPSQKGLDKVLKAYEDHADGN